MRLTLNRPRSAANVSSFRRPGALLGVALIAIVGVGCSTAGPAVADASRDGPLPVVPPATATQAPVSALPDPTAVGSRSDSSDDSGPSRVLRQLNPNGPKTVDLRQFRQLLPRDAIRPIYEPKIAAGSQVNLPSGELVIGVSIGDDSRAYPIRTLRFREIVNDRLGGVPILVTW